MQSVNRQGLFKAGCGMKRMAWVTGVALLFWAALAWGKDILPVSLVEGENAIAVSLANKGKNDLYTVSASIDKSGLPQWLRIGGVAGSVDVPQGMKSGKKFCIHCTVKGAPPGAEAKIPLTLKDGAGGVWTYSFIARVSGVSPVQDYLFENYPNPFNPSTSLSFSLKESRQTSLVIYNALGQKIRTLLSEPRSAGKHTIVWNGRDDGGRAVSSGTYFFRLTSGSFVQTRRMTLVE